MSAVVPAVLSKDRLSAFLCSLFRLSYLGENLAGAAGQIPPSPVQGDSRHQAEVLDGLDEGPPVVQADLPGGLVLEDDSGEAGGNLGLGTGEEKLPIKAAGLGKERGGRFEIIIC